MMIVSTESLERTFFFHQPRSAESEGGSAAWAGLGDEVVSEERYNALRMAHGVGEG